MQWTITKRSNNRYVLLNKQTGHYAHIPDEALENQQIRARPEAREWKIASTGESNVYTYALWHNPSVQFH